MNKVVNYHPDGVLHPQYFQIGKIPIKVERMTEDNVVEAYNMLRLSMRKGNILYCSKDAFRRLMPCMMVFTKKGTIVAIAGIIFYSAEHSEFVKLLVTPQPRKSALAKHVINIGKATARGNSKFLFASGVGDSNKRFFLSHGFQEVSREDVPPEKWVDYPVDRDSWVVRLELDPKKKG